VVFILVILKNFSYFLKGIRSYGFESEDLALSDSSASIEYSTGAGYGLEFGLNLIQKNEKIKQIS